jgi:hypothetical protein
MVRGQARIDQSLEIDCRGHAMKTHDAAEFPELSLMEGGRAMR